MPESMNRAGHLFAEVKGTKGKKILLVGHLDTVFEPDSPFQRYELHDSIATGPGTSDMKGGNMVLLFALKALHQANLLKNTQIVVALHGDEENAGDPLSISRKDIIDVAKRSDIALAYEDATEYDYATIARRGSSDWKLVVHGKQAHSSLIFRDEIGAGAIYETSRILYRFYNELKEDLLTFNPGLIAGGTKVSVDSTGTFGNTSGKDNIIANTVIVHGDLRFISEEQKAAARKKMQAIVKDNLPNTSAEITFNDSYPAMSPTSGNMELLKVYSKVSIDLGMGEVKPFDPGKRGAGDISFIAEYVDALDGLGVTGGGGHSLSEYMEIHTVGDQIKRTALLLYRLTR
jgi:glutamate carboxypeptidase